MEQSNNSDQTFGLNQRTVNFLLEVSKWAKFLAILGFIFIGLIVLIGLFMGTVASAFMPMQTPFAGGLRGFMVIIYLGIAVLYFFPVFYLFRFSVQVQGAIRSQDSLLIESAMENLRNHYRFVGILTIIVLSLYVLGIIFMGIFAGVMMH